MGREGVLGRLLEALRIGRRDEPQVDVSKPIVARSVEDFTNKLSGLGRGEPPKLRFVVEDFRMPDGMTRKRHGFVVQAISPKGTVLDFPVTLEVPHAHHSEEIEDEEAFLSAYYVTEAIYASTRRYTKIIQPGTEDGLISMTDRRERALRLEQGGYDPLKASEIISVLPPPHPTT